MKLKPNQKTMLFSLSFLMIFCILLMTLTQCDYATFTLPTATWIFHGFTLLGFVFFYLLARFTYYYELTDTVFVEHRIFKKRMVAYQDILYIDEERSKQLDAMVLYNTNGQEFLCVLDREKILMEEIKKRAQHRIERDEFIRKFPERLRK